MYAWANSAKSVLHFSVFIIIDSHPAAVYNYILQSDFKVTCNTEVVFGSGMKPKILAFDGVKFTAVSAPRVNGCVLKFSCVNIFLKPHLMKSCIH